MENRLMRALELGDFKLARIIINGGHDLNFCTNSGTSPLMLACKFAACENNISMKLDIICTLLGKNANINAKDNKGRTALAYAMHSRCKATIQMLKKEGLVITIDAKINRSKGNNKIIWDSFDLDDE
ncbi:ankyrin repeat domain-containing protein 34C-like [Mytilus trossulus]|uniref:ankyrin repeat domain-containing protein 34C-like n=1 Tax=Mytilus trossulus TaxID=6551 RepID=UPI0030071D0F